MPKFQIVRDRQVVERQTVIIEADSDSAVRQALIDEDLGGNIDILEATDLVTHIEEVSADTLTTEEAWEAEAAANPTVRVVWFGVVDHRHGANHYAAASQEEVESQVAAYCRDWAEQEGITIAEGDTDKDIIEAYFEKTEDEHFDLVHLDVVL